MTYEGIELIFQAQNLKELYHLIGIKGIVSIFLVVLNCLAIVFGLYALIFIVPKRSKELKAKAKAINDNIRECNETIDRIVEKQKRYDEIESAYRYLQKEYRRTRGGFFDDDMRDLYDRR